MLGATLMDSSAWTGVRASNQKSKLQMANYIQVEYMPLGLTDTPTCQVGELNVASRFGGATWTELSPVS